MDLLWLDGLMANAGTCLATQMAGSMASGGNTHGRIRGIPSDGFCGLLIVSRTKKSGGPRPTQNVVDWFIGLLLYSFIGLLVCLVLFGIISH